MRAVICFALLLAGNYLSLIAQALVLDAVDDYEGVLVERRLHLPGISSGSGLARLADDRWLIVGDDDNNVSVVDDEGHVIQQVALSQVDEADSTGRIPKDVKRDYEALATYEEAGGMKFIAFGSGSKFPVRTWVLLGSWVDDGLQVEEVKATEFYFRLMLQAHIAPEEMNIEGATVVGKDLLLFNREDNQIVSIDLAHALQVIRNQAKILESDLVVTPVILPHFAGVFSGLSGACTQLQDGRVYFCASVEDKMGSINDGQILGSYVGWMVWDPALEVMRPQAFHLIDKLGNRTFDKLESVEVLRSDAEGIRLVGVTDDDTGGSEWLQIFIPAKFLSTQDQPQIEGKD